MGCKVTGTSYYDCDFACHSGKSVTDEECTIGPSTKDVKHFVVVSPVKKKFSSIRVTGRIVADPSTAKAHFAGGSVFANNIEWQETKSISTVDVTFDSASIRHISAGSENIEIKVEELNRWTKVYNQIDQNDLTFTVNLS
jgi:hypothetical protein